MQKDRKRSDLLRFVDLYSCRLGIRKQELGDHVAVHLVRHPNKMALKSAASLSDESEVSMDFFLRTLENSRLTGSNTHVIWGGHVIQKAKK